MNAWILDTWYTVMVTISKSCLSTNRFFWVKYELQMSHIPLPSNTAVPTLQLATMPTFTCLCRPSRPSLLMWDWNLIMDEKETLRLSLPEWTEKMRKTMMTHMSHTALKQERENMCGIIWLSLCLLQTFVCLLFHRSWPVEWSSHPHPECWIPVNFQATTENSSLSTLLDYIKKYKNSLFQNLHLSLYLSLLPLLACTYLNNAWDLVLLALPLYVCLFKINRFMYSPIVSRFG